MNECPVSPPPFVVRVAQRADRANGFDVALREVVKIRTGHYEGVVPAERRELVVDVRLGRYVGEALTEAGDVDGGFAESSLPRL